MIKTDRQLNWSETAPIISAKQKRIMSKVISKQLPISIFSTTLVLVINASNKKVKT